MGNGLKIGIFTAFAVALYVIAQTARETALAYFSFFPLAFILAFYFFDGRDWIFSGLTLVFLAAAYGYAFGGTGFRFLQEFGAFSVIGTFSFAGLVYHRYVGEEKVQKEEEHCARIRAELTELKQKHATRVESLLHLEKQVASLINLFEIARDFNECLDLKETAQILYKKVLPELFFEEARLVVLAKDPVARGVSKIYGVTREGVEEKEKIPPASSEMEWLRKLEQEKKFTASDDLWLFPFFLEGEFNGFLAVRGAEKQDLAKFEVLTAQLALQVRKVSLYEMVRELSIIDGLTGTFVRRHFLERFEEEIRRALKHGFPLSVLMLDIDHFKRYNDDFGHLVGDATLKEVAEVIRANVRNVDIVARYGGEEFAVVIPETREEGAVEVAERIRSAVARRAVRIYGEETKVTVSIGIAVFPQDLSKAPTTSYDPTYPFELLQKADVALYRAKEEGRNRVMTYRALGHPTFKPGRKGP